MTSQLHESGATGEHKYECYEEDSPSEQVCYCIWHNRKCKVGDLGADNYAVEVSDHGLF